MPFKEEIPDLVKWINSRVESLDRDFSVTPAERAVQYYRYHGQPFQFRGFEWQIQILNDMHPRQVIQKRSQVGLTTIMMFKVILFLEQHAFMPHWFMSDAGVEMSIFPTAIYTLENDDKVREFSADRIKDLVRDNPYLEGLLEEGEVDQISLKKFGRAGLYLGGRKSISAVTTIPAQVVMADEWDRTFDPSVGEQLESRLKASPMFRARTQKGMLIKFSTPEMENWGVAKLREDLSDQMTFMIRCHRCNEWQEMLYPDSIANWYDKGEKPKPDLYYQCLKCHQSLDFSEIGKWRKEEPLKIHNCEWVPKRKEYYETVTRHGEGVRGYMVPWAYSTSVQEVMNDRDTKSTAYFNHHVLGIPYEDKKSGLSSELFKSICRSEVRYGFDPQYMHVMGVDQGAYIAIWRLIPFSRADLLPFGKWQMVHGEFCPDSLAFNNFEKGLDGKLIPKPGRLNALMDQWKIALCVIDAEPSGNDALNFQQDYVKEKRVWVNHSTKVNVDDPRLGFNWVENDIEPNQEEIFLGRISEDHTGAIDAYFDFLYQGCLEIPEHEDNIHSIISHHRSLRKTTTEKKMPFGRIKYETIYYSTGLDHYAHACKFAYQAACLYFKLSFFNPKIILASGNIDGVKMFQSKR